MVNPDGTVNLVEGSTDIGGTRVSLSMQLAETLGIRAEDIKPAVVDSDTVGFNDQTGGSRTTFATGWAVYNAGNVVIHTMCERAALLWDVSPDEVNFAAGVFSSEGKSLSFKELAGKLGETGGPVVTSVSVHPETEGVAYATHIVDVAVDVETGKVDILRYTAIQDVGTAIHPAYVEGQMQGGAAQGIGWALNEEYIYDDQGRLVNGNLLGLSRAYCAGFAHAGRRDCGSAQPRASLRRARRGRSAHRAAGRGRGKCNLSRHWRANAHTSHVATAHHGSALGVMATIFIPSLLRDLTGGITETNVPGRTLREVIDALDRTYPGLKERLCDEDRIRPNIAVVVDGLRSAQGLHTRVNDTSEVHFVPAISGGHDA